MDKISGRYWRFWSGRLSKDAALTWLNFFEPNTEKWFQLYELANGFQGRVNNFDDALVAFDSVFYRNSANKISFKNVILLLFKLKRTYRYELAKEAAIASGYKSFGGKWAHSLQHYSCLLIRANVVQTSYEYFGRKKSFGRIRRQVYSVNFRVADWRIPYRPWLAEKTRIASLSAVSARKALF